MTAGNELEPEIDNSASKQSVRPPKPRSRIGAILGLLLVVYFVAVWRTGHWNPLSSSSNLALSFDGDTQGLKATQIVPTLDTPIEKGKNVIWCATFAAGWKQLQQKVTNGPVNLTDAAEVCARLNAAPDPAPTMPPEAFYANAGTTDKGIIQTIHHDMRSKFPKHIPPAFEGVPGGGFVLYSYIEARVPFTLKYSNNPAPLEFTGSDGEKTAIRSFGFGSPDYKKHRLKEQPCVLVVRAQDPPPKPPERAKLVSYAVDLCRDSRPYQIVVARVERKPSLAATLDSLDEEIKAFETKGGVESLSEGILRVPDMFWGLSHHYRELEERRIVNPEMQGQSVDIALQDIQFRLDRSGADVASESESTPVSAVYEHESNYVFDGPFLLYIKKRGDATPFFVMWIDNAELLQRWG
ncbi:MAG: hypothetical protein HZB26_08465 [Candidatus Hydrogenedentes bacterium]|nr:hypothetical protein [Candidatus Hydrogenedentota bacterium]